MLKKRLLVTLLAVSIPLSSHASVQTSMQSWFNDIGAYGNVTGPAAYQGQTMNLYTGGSLYMRTPVKNYQLATVSPPGFKAGCGGIDLFAGSFSFINKEQLTALLRNIANNAIGYAFMMAVKSISPDLADLMQYLQDQISKVNNLNINSCQAAEGMPSTPSLPKSAMRRVPRPIWHKLRRCDKPATRTRLWPNLRKAPCRKCGMRLNWFSTRYFRSS